MPRSLYPPGMTRYLLYGRLGGPQGRSGRVRKISSSTRIRSPSSPYRVAVPAHRLLLVLNINCSSGIYKGNEDFISFPNRTFHFRNHFLTFREILGLDPNQKLFSSLILTHSGSYNPQFHIATFISHLWLCLCRKQNEANKPKEASIKSA